MERVKFSVSPAISARRCRMRRIIQPGRCHQHYAVKLFAGNGGQFGRHPAAHRKAHQMRFFRQVQRVQQQLAIGQAGDRIVIGQLMDARRRRLAGGDVHQRTDQALLINKLETDRWYLTTFKAHEWNPALHNIAQPLDLILGSEYAAKPQRLRTILRRLADVPEFYQAAQAMSS